MKKGNGLKIGAVAVMLLLLAGGVTVSTALGKPLLKTDKYTADQIEAAFQELSPYVEINSGLHADTGYQRGSEKWSIS